MLNPNVTFPTIVLRYPGGGGSMRPPPVNFVVGHNCSSPPPQNIGRLGGPTGVGGRSQLHTTSATAPSVARNVTSLCLNMTLASECCGLANALDRKSTRLNSSHLVISYAVFCLKKKKKY